MSALPIASLYAGLLALLLVLLTIRVVAARRGAQVAIGDGGDKVLQRRIRAHANFAEYVPIALILLALAEAGGAWWWLLHAIGAALLAGRIIHAANISSLAERIPLRVAGMSLTLTAISAGAVVNLLLVLGRL